MMDWLWAGVDGCRGGWAVAGISADGRLRPIERHDHFASVVAAAAGARLVLVDIPIGLADEGRRDCDRLARRYLGPRCQSVFWPPVRAALEARSHAEASRINREAAGYGLSIQAWNIVPKMREVDTVLRRAPGLAHRFRESHPELVFAALNGWRPLPPKRTRGGQEARLRLLEQYVPEARDRTLEAVRLHRRAGLAADDAVDAVALAVTARLALAAGVPTLPSEPPHDACGLPSAVVLPFRGAHAPQEPGALTPGRPRPGSRRSPRSAPRE